MPPSPPKPLRRWLRRFAWPFVFLCALSLVCYILRAPLLTRAARAWVVDEPATKADAIVVLGGGLERRALAAAKLFRNGAASRILYMDVRLSLSEERGMILSQRELTRRILLSNGVPDTAMAVVGQGVNSTYDESKAVQAWVQKSGAKSIIIPTDLFHTRRARWVFRRELRGAKTEIHVVPVAPEVYTINNWWQHKEGVTAFQSEIAKSLYYHLKY